MTVALFLGIATRSGRPLLVLPRFAVADVHRFASLAGTLLVVLHMALLFFDPYAQLRLVDFIVPLLGTYRPVWLGLGTLAFDLLTGDHHRLLRHRLGVRSSARSIGRPTPCGRQPWRTHSGTEPTPATGGSCCSPGVARSRCAAHWGGDCRPTTPSTPAPEHRGAHDDLTTPPPSGTADHPSSVRGARPGPGRTPTAVRAVARVSRDGIGAPA